MARFSGEVGYNHGTIESPPNSGIFIPSIVEKHYYGDVIRSTTRMDTSQSVNPNVSVNNSIRVVADAFANENFQAIRYVRWAGKLWTVTSVEVQSPRLLLELGGVYNGPTT
jgi:hypothetical protein